MSKTSVAIRPHSVGTPSDTHPGIAWWNSLPEPERRNWLAMAGTACVADAWKLRCQLMAGIHGRKAA